MRRKAAHSFRRRASGVTLTETLLGIAILVFVVVSTTYIFGKFAANDVSRELKVLAERLLKSTSEDMRAQAQYQFETMDYQNLNVSSDPRVAVYVSVGPILPAERTRNVDIVAAWNDPRQAAGGTVINGKSYNSTKELTLIVQHLRPSLPVARVKVKVLKQGTTTGVAGVVITGDAPGPSGTKTSCVTDNSGTCELFNVAPAPANTSQIFVNAGNVRHYFKTNGGAPYYFSQTFTLAGAVDVGVENTELYTNPIYVWPPSVLQGSVKNTFNTSVGIAGIDMYLVAKPGTMLINYDMSDAERIIQTDSSGNYKYGALLPGSYYLYVLGNSQYCAEDVPGTFYQSFSSYTIVVGENTTVTKDFNTVRKGTISGTVSAMNYSAGSFSVGSAAPTGLKVRYYMSPYLNYTTVSGSDVTSDFLYTTTWREVFSKNYTFRDGTTISGNGSGYITTTNAGAYSLTNLGPYILNDINSPDDAWPGNPSATDKYAKNSTGQFTYVAIRPDFANIPDPLTPIMVSGTINPNLLLFAKDTSKRLVPSNGTFSLFSPKLYANNTTTSYNVYLLNQSALANFGGNITDSSGVTPFSGPTGVVSFSWDVGGYGGIRFDTTNNTCYLDPVYTVNSVKTSSPASHRYDFMITSGRRPLPPSVGADQVGATFIAKGNQNADVNKVFRVKVRAFEKVLVNNQITYRQVPNASIAPLQVKYYKDDGTQAWSQDANISLTSGNFDSPSHGVENWQKYSGATDAFVLTPGMQNADQTIKVSLDAVPYFRTYYLYANPSTGASDFMQYRRDNNFLGEPFNYSNAAFGMTDYDVFVGTITLHRKAVADKIYGHVWNASTNPPSLMVGVNVTIQVSGRPMPSYVDRSDVTKLNSSNDCTTGGACTYKIQNIKFLELSGSNFTAIVDPTSAYPGFEKVTRSTEGWTNCAFQWDFYLLPTATGGGPAPAGQDGNL